MSVETIKKVYGLLDRVTPFVRDCGKICNNKCCKGNDKDGMLLFPGEEELFLKDESFILYYDRQYGHMCVRCNGKCDRNKRPLSCRIFPYFIYCTDKITVAPDIRAKDYCPILSQNISVDKRFLRALRISGKKLYCDEEIKSFLCEITNKLIDFNDL